MTELLLPKKLLLKLGLSISFVLCMISNYTVGENANFLLEQENIRYIVYFVSFIFLLFFIYCNRELEISKSCFFKTFSGIIGVLLLILFYNHGVDDLFRLLVLFPFLFIKPIQETKIKKILSFSLYVGVLVSLCLSVYNGIFFDGEVHKGRLLTNSNDPNFSAVYAMLGFMASDKINNRKTKFCYLLIGIFTQSRNFILFLISFYVVRWLKCRSAISKINPLLSFVLLQIGVVLFGGYMLLRMSFDNQNLLADGSNKLRFTYTAEGIVYLLSGKEAIFNGAGAAYWSTAKGGTGSAGTTGALHNSYLSLMVEKGIIYAIINLCFLFLIVDKNYTLENVEYVYSFLIPTLFLGGMFSGIFLYSWCYILSIRKYMLGEVIL